MDKLFEREFRYPITLFYPLPHSLPTLTAPQENDARVCNLARASAMARVVLAQIEFTRATRLAQNSTYVMVIIFHDNSPLSYWNPVPIHDSYETIRSS